MIAKFILSDRHRRPVFGFISGNSYHTALLDTGAEIPVFTYGAAKMKAIGGKYEGKCGAFKGFGGECVGDLYRVDLTIGALRYSDVPVICIHDPSMGFSFILPATLFNGFRYTIDDNAKMLTVDTLSSAREYRFKDPCGGTTDVLMTIDESRER